MFKLKTGYFVSGIITGLILLFNFFVHLPDGKLHVIFCDVGQGDAAYIQFPKGRDMLIDAGPGGKSPQVLGCLARHMPFFDRYIDVVVISHPEEDHMGGVEEILKRYGIGTVVRSALNANSERYVAIQSLLKEKHISERIVAAGEDITIGSVTLHVLWPPRETAYTGQGKVLGTSHPNDASVIMHLSYGMFDVLFPGDADSGVDTVLTSRPFINQDGLEFLKVPHHGAKTAMTDAFMRWIGPTTRAIISVGRNTFGHPSKEAMDMLTAYGISIQRTDQMGDIEVVSDGQQWIVHTERSLPLSR